MNVIDLLLGMELRLKSMLLYAPYPKSALPMYMGKDRRAACHYIIHCHAALSNTLYTTLKIVTMACCSGF